MTENQFDLRPLDYAGMLDRTFELYKRHYKLFITIAAVVYVPLTLIQVALQLNPGAYVFAGLVGVAWFGGYVLSSAAILYAVSRSYLGHPPTVGESYSAVLSIAFPLLLTWLILGLALGLVGGGVAVAVAGAVAGSMHGGSNVAGLVVAGIVAIAVVVLLLVVSLRLMFINQVVVLERTFYGAALSRSNQLVSGEMLRVFVMFFLVMALNVAISMAGGVVVGVFSYTLGGESARILLQVLDGALKTAIYPLGMIVFTLLYYDIRIRKEAFDLQMLSSHVYQTSPPYAGATEHAATGGYVERPATPYFPAAPVSAPPPAPSWGPPIAEVAPPIAPTLIRCSACGAQSPADSAFCAECGHAMQ